MGLAIIFVVSGFGKHPGISGFSEHEKSPLHVCGGLMVIGGG